MSKKVVSVPQTVQKQSLAPWLEAGFSEQEASAWMRLISTRPFTPGSARWWMGEGFGPADAAMWREVYADPRIARAVRSDGETEPPVV